MLNDGFTLIVSSLSSNELELHDVGGHKHVMRSQKNMGIILVEETIIGQRMRSSLVGGRHGSEVIYQAHSIPARRSKSQNACEQIFQDDTHIFKFSQVLSS
ncbi:unnamed protein product [Dovyalis caffra]|uniref:Uncharacterized protein n=1 Tax=Dovyalis caffra TaxID=77055 RepID=A0AAV1QXJ1_9ROSI|nr:unnamed protein product [Dovyalis caffra]